MPDLKDLADQLIENMTARRAAVSQAIEALEALDGAAVPQKKQRGRPVRATVWAAKTRKKFARIASAETIMVRDAESLRRRIKSMHPASGKAKRSVRLPRASFLEAVTRTLKASGKPMRVVAIRDALLKGECKGRNPKALYNQICNNLAGKKAFKRGPGGVSLA